ncbi:uncharacterized protein [Rutidosis leptorrhynchoides]|uniref:uncharacterized protein n=1 Tax=Rutidosis leptorrhynchoides TaxID=125765 RepID=UPI003A99B7CF
MRWTQSWGNNTWVLADLPPGCKRLGSKWIFKNKMKVDGTIEKFKARLLIALSAIHNLVVHPMDVKTSFLNGTLDEEVYMNQPQGFVMPGNEGKVDLTKEFLSSKFSMKDMGEVDVILGIRIIRENNVISISQSHYIEKVLKNFNCFDCTPVITSMDPSVKYTSNPSTHHCQAIRCVLKYLKKTMDYSLSYTGFPSVIEGYPDAIWMTNVEDHSSASGWLFLLGGGAISWAFKKKTLFVRSQQNLADHLTKGLARGLVDKSAKLEYIILYHPKVRNVLGHAEGELKFSFLMIHLKKCKSSNENFIGRGGFGNVYKGLVTHANGSRIKIAAKRMDTTFGHAERQFLTELEILLEYKHENVIGLVGYCDEMDEKVIVYEYASRGSLDKHLKSVDLTWMKRLKICIEMASALEFLLGGSATQEVVLHRDIKSANILLMEDWKAKLSDFGLSLISSINQETGYVIDNVCGTYGYADPLYLGSGFLTRESDIHSFGVVL